MFPPTTVIEYSVDCSRALVSVMHKADHSSLPPPLRGRDGEGGAADVSDRTLCHSQMREFSVGPILSTIEDGALYDLWWGLDAANS